MKICHYNDNQAGAVKDDQVYPLGDALVKAGYLGSNYTMGAGQKQHQKHPQRL